MKNFRMSKRLLTLLLAGGITVTSLACAISSRGNKQNTPPVMTSISYASELPSEAPVAGEISVEKALEIIDPIGKVTLTENTIDMPSDVTLSTQEAVVTSEPISEVMRYYQEFSLSDCHAKAATLNSSVLRSGPGTDYPKVDVLYRGAIVEVLGRSNNDWYLISFNGNMYFTIGTNITLINYLYDDQTLQDIVPNLTLAIQPTTKLNVRQEPKKDSLKLGLISGKRTYKVLDYLDNGWYKIDYQGKEAYVKGQYCRETYILDGRFYQYVYPKHDCYLYDEYGNVKRDLEKWEGGPVYDENDEYYLIWIGEDWGLVRREDVKIAQARVIDVDLSLQQATVIDGSEMLMQLDTCTGKPSTPTDKGVYSLGGETGPIVLRGPGYECPVENFARVNGGEGFHPYKCDNYGDVDGAASHGCYRLRPDEYEEFFRLTKEGDMVVTHR